MEKIVALDLFAGTGWGVACKRLGIEEGGVELMDEAVATRTANGMVTLYRDVWDGLLLDAESHELLYGEYNLLIASPPCQTFSAAGKGAGRKALNEVLEAIDQWAYMNPEALLAFGEAHDIRTALVLSPLAYIWRDRPQLVALEQVPTVQPVWDAYADEMRRWGYQVETRILNAEQYGVPQTRRRAILVANLDGPVSLPTPTHSRYYPRTPEKLDPGVLKWVSMAEALGWNRDGVTFTQNNKLAHQSHRTLDAPAPTVTAGHDSGNRGFTDPEGDFMVATTAEVAVLQSYPVYRNGNQANAAKRPLDAPAPTVHFGGRSNKVEWMAPGLADDPSASGRRVEPEEAAALQSYPTGRGLTDRPSPTITGGGTETGGAEPIAKYHERYTGAPGWQGSTERLSTDEAAALQSYPTHMAAAGTSCQLTDPRPVTAPAATITGAATAEWGYRPGRAAGPMQRDPDGRRVEPEEAAALQSYPTELRPEVAAWKWVDAPATTVAGDPRITAREHHYHGEQSKTSLRLEQEEAHALQTFPTEPPFIWCGSKSKVFLQIGNAVPPLLAQHILAALIQGTEAAPRAEIRPTEVPNSELPSRRDLIGMHVETSATDTRGRLVSGELVSARKLDSGGIGVKLKRYLDGEEVLDGARLPEGDFLPGRPFTSVVHIPAYDGLDLI